MQVGQVIWVKGRMGVILELTGSHARVAFGNGTEVWVHRIDR